MAIIRLSWVRPKPFAAAQRNIDIVANPSGQADVPSVPEVADVDGAKRRGKVFRQLEAEQHGCR